MHIRSTAVLFALSLAACHGSDYVAPSTPASSHNGLSAYPQEKGAAGMATEPKAPTPPTAPATPATPPAANSPPSQIDVASVPPPSAGTSTPTPNAPAAPFKPGSADHPPAIGGGPKSETGGSVIGDGHSGNTGAIKGGDPTAPPKQ